MMLSGAYTDVNINPFCPKLNCRAVEQMECVLARNSGVFFFLQWPLWTKMESSWHGLIWKLHGMIWFFLHYGLWKANLTSSQWEVFFQWDSAAQPSTTWESRCLMWWVDPPWKTTSNNCCRYLLEIKFDQIRILSYAILCIYIRMIGYVCIYIRSLLSLLSIYPTLILILILSYPILSNPIYLFDLIWSVPIRSSQRSFEVPRPPPAASEARLAKLGGHQDLDFHGNQDFTKEHMGISWENVWRNHQEKWWYHVELGDKKIVNGMGYIITLQ